MTLLFTFLLLLAVGLLIGYTVDKLKVGGDGIWYGHGEPPEGFVGFWDKGDVVVQWPEPAELVLENAFTAENIISNTITADSIISGAITAQNITTTEIIPDPDRPGYLTTKQELAQRREDNA